MTALLSIRSSDIRASRIIPGEMKVEDTDSIESENLSVIKRCHQILSYYEDEANKPENEIGRWLTEQLSEEEQEVAAKCSYAYWFLSTQQDSPMAQSVRFATAQREAYRHRNCADSREEVLKLLKATIEFHTTNKSWLYRTCMTTNDGVSNATESLDDVFLSQKRKDRIYDEMANYQTNVVRGHDKEGRSIFFAYPRKLAGKPDSESEQAFVDSVIYTLERTLAITEFRTIGRQDELFCVLDTKGGSCPPFKTLQAAVGVLQQFYPNRLKHCVVLNAPYILGGIWKMLKPFLDPTTASKFVFPSSRSKGKGKPSPIDELVDESQAMDVLMPGRGRLPSDVDVDHFLYRVPYHSLYDSCEVSTQDDVVVERPEVLKLRSPTGESNSTASLSMTDSLSIDSRNSRSKSRRRSSFLRGIVVKAKRQNGKPKDKVVTVSVRSLATGALAVESPMASSSAVVVNTLTLQKGSLTQRPRSVVVG